MIICSCLLGANITFCLTLSKENNWMWILKSQVYWRRILNMLMLILTPTLDILVHFCAAFASHLFRVVVIRLILDDSLWIYGLFTVEINKNTWKRNISLHMSYAVISKVFLFSLNWIIMLTIPSLFCFVGNMMYIFCTAEYIVKKEIKLKKSLLKLYLIILSTTKSCVKTVTNDQPGSCFLATWLVSLMLISSDSSSRGVVKSLLLIMKNRRNITFLSENTYIYFISKCEKWGKSIPEI